MCTYVEYLWWGGFVMSSRVGPCKAQPGLPHAGHSQSQLTHCKAKNARQAQEVGTKRVRKSRGNIRLGAGTSVPWWSQYPHFSQGRTVSKQRDGSKALLPTGILCQPMFSQRTAVHGKPTPEQRITASFCNHQILLWWKQDAKEKEERWGFSSPPNRFTRAAHRQVQIKVYNPNPR